MPFKAGEIANPKGGPSIKKAASALLRKAITKIETAQTLEKGKKFNYYEYAVQASLTDNTLLAKILGKILPDLKAIDVDITQDSPYRLIIEFPQHRADKVEQEAIEGVKGVPALPGAVDDAMPVVNVDALNMALEAESEDEDVQEQD